MRGALGRCCAAAIAICSIVATRTPAATAEDDRFEKEVIVSGGRDAMQMDIAADGRLIFVERAGAVKLWRPHDRQTVLLGEVPVAVFSTEVGMVGMVLDNDFARTGWVYLCFCPADQPATMRISRFTIAGEKLDPASEKKLLDYPIDADAAIHMGGGLAIDAGGNLFLGTGDNSPPIPEIPVDQRPGKEAADALRTSANSNDLRGKILRIHPRADGGYDIPAGNLFADATGGRPEIYCLGCRNPFRISVERQSGRLYWGDVGPNVMPELKIGPEGYDEINQTRTAGNFGWPMFIGPNEVYRNFDFETHTVGEPFDLERPLNHSRNNTGAKLLPPPRPAWIWYPSGESPVFPELGSGGRSAMAGPVYHYRDDPAATMRIPHEYDGALFIHDWMRNWIKVVRADEQDKPTRIESFLPRMIFRKPIDLKFGPDGTLYVIDYGTLWSGNADSQILRIVYHRGNRPPVAVVHATPDAGKQPLEVRLSAKNSSDKDSGDRLSFAWTIGADPPIVSHDTEFVARLDRPGTYPVELVVSDSQGATSIATTEIRVGNAPPKIVVREPRTGSFFDWDDRVRFRFDVSDEEDEQHLDRQAMLDRVRVQGQYAARRPRSDHAAQDQSADEELLEPGFALMRKTTCFSCHTTQTSSGGGPPYFEVSRKYQGQPAARDQLVRKILRGGGGVWGSKLMPPHPQHTVDQTQAMVDWVLSLAADGTGTVVTGAEGVIKLPSRPAAKHDAGVFVLSAVYADQGADGAPPLLAESSVVLRSRRQRAVAFDRRQQVELIEIYERQVGPVGRFANGGWIAFDDLDLRSIERVVCHAAAVGTVEATFELRSGAPDGELLGSASLAPGDGSEQFTEISIPIQPPEKPGSLFVLAKGEGAEGGNVASLDWLEFFDSTSAGDARRAQQQELATLPLAPPAAATARAIVKEWTFADLVPVLERLDRGRSFDRGKALFTTATCSTCHKLGQEGGSVGPDLSDVFQRLSRQPEPNQALLREVVTPSEVIDPKYRTVMVVTIDGTTISGLIARQDDQSVSLITDPLRPAVLKEIPLADIDERHESPRSLMPDGLLNTLDKDEILDLLAYIKSGGDSSFPAFQK